MRPHRPYFLWDVDVTEDEVRELLRQPDAGARAQWQGRVLREARYNDVWRYLTLEDVLENWPRIERHLGRRRPFWKFLFAQWRRHGLLAS